MRGMADRKMTQTDKRQQLNIALNLLDDGVRSSLNQIEVLTETLRTMFPEFAAAYAKQNDLLRKRDAAQRKKRFAEGQQSAHPIIDLVDAVYARKRAKRAL